MVLGAVDLGDACLEKMCLRKVYMDVAEKKERLKKWISEFPFLESYVVKADNVLEHTSNVDALCRSLVKDYYVCNRLSEKYGRKASMLPANANMYMHSDIRVEGHDGKMISIDTKYPTWNFSRSSAMWFEVDKNSASKADKTMYVAPNGYCWILDRKKCLETLSSKPAYAGLSGNMLCKFRFDEVARHGAIKEFIGLEGVFDELDEDLQRRFA